MTLRRDDIISRLFILSNGWGVRARLPDVSDDRKQTLYECQRELEERLAEFQATVNADAAKRMKK